MLINEQTHSTGHTPKVSVILPNYNYARYLNIRMDSILKQTYQDFEIIILDDASTDNSREIIETFRQNPKVSIIEYNERNTGIPCAQWEKGVNLAKGEYIWITEIDDLADPTFLDTAVRELEADKNASIFFSMANVINSEGEIYKKEKNRFMLLEPRYKLFRSESAYRFSGPFFMKYYLAWYNSIYNASGTVFRKDCVNRQDWTDAKKFRTCGDWAFWSSIVSKGGNVIIGRDKLNYFRIHQSSATKYLVRNYSNLYEAMMVMKSNISHLNERRKKIIIGNFYRNTINNETKSAADKICFQKMYLTIFGKKLGKDALTALKLNRSIITKCALCYISPKKDHSKRDFKYKNHD